MKLNYAAKIADEIVAKICPYCAKIQIAGSIRRQNPEVNDIDIVLIPSDAWNLESVIAELARPGLQKNGDEYKMFKYKGVQVDLYFATEVSWYTKLLIRTGSKENNIRLAAKAKSMGYHLHANGLGLFDSHGAKIAGESEESIYDALNLLWQEPYDRG
jgi:DNA polymerase/3'-5' exonuclease PolX